MRFLALIYPGGWAESGAMPDQQSIARMMKFNESLGEKGALLALDGLYPSAKGARIAYANGAPTVTDGPFTESKEVVGGFWIVKADSKEQAVELFKHCPAADGDRIDIRQIYDMEDYEIDPASEIGQQVDRVEAALGQANRA
jgi:hypothetical protein